ncbi:MAG: carbamoyltransferase HypF [Candidatus Sumerlaeaceae bacterium]|nr:carbamoyltransferase HypF [Candidatus Sumerlaeaceae bacterium]
MNAAASKTRKTPAIARRRLEVSGAVQGVGFRPFVYRLALKLGLTGWVENTASGVTIEIEGLPELLDGFVSRLHSEKPPRSSVSLVSAHEVLPLYAEQFEIRRSTTNGPRTALVIPDIGICGDCRRELLTPGDRRHLYPFINCTNCGPRFTIMEGIPYDRPNTTMKNFVMCSDCQEEYDNPLDRRFHAQPNACHKCGPQVRLVDSHGQLVAGGENVFRVAGNLLRGGLILALKGIGGFQLLVNARDEAAVLRLRDRKHREGKPLALMVPSIESARDLCEVCTLEEELLQSAEAPIVILRRRARSVQTVAESVAPGNPSLGLMLPYSPLHILLMRELGFPVVATSGNLSSEPICTDEAEALTRLEGIADAFLVHDRPIARHADDSVVRVMAGRPMVIRRARGYAPLPVSVPQNLNPILATGAHLKNTVAVARGHFVSISQHIGDLETAEAFRAFRKTAYDLEQLLDVIPESVMCDAHPDYLSSQFARQRGLPVRAVQHHYAHVLACMADNRLESPVLGVAWDGTGYGDDGTIWGGEFLAVDATGYSRAAHLRQFRLPGGDAAVRKPWRAALGLLFELFDGDMRQLAKVCSPISPEWLPCFADVDHAELEMVMQQLSRNLNCPLTSSAGRLFDAVAALAGVRSEMDFEGQAAMDLENCLDPQAKIISYEMALRKPSTLGEPLQLDWTPMVAAILADVRQGKPAGFISAAFHNGLVRGIVQVAIDLKAGNIALTGGCFQNKYLLESAVAALRQAGLMPHWHFQVPPNDNGIALGQIAAAARKERKNVPCGTG